MTDQKKRRPAIAHLLSVLRPLPANLLYSLLLDPPFLLYSLTPLPQSILGVPIPAPSPIRADVGGPGGGASDFIPHPPLPAGTNRSLSAPGEE